MNTLARIVRAREALEDGDVGFAYAIVCDLEEDLAGNRALADSAPGHDRFVHESVCPDCGHCFRFPGQLADHRDFVHWPAAA